MELRSFSTFWSTLSSWPCTTITLHYYQVPPNMQLSTCSDSISASSCFTFSSSMGRMSGCSLSLSATPKLSPPRSMSSSILLNSSVYIKGAM